MINNKFFSGFLKISNYYTIISIILLVASILLLKGLKDKKVSFAKRMIISLFLGLILGVGLDVLGSSNNIFTEFARVEITTWYSLVGSGFLKLVQLLAVPVVFLSIIEVMTNIKSDSIKTLTWKSFLTLLGTTAIAAIVAISVVKIYNLNASGFAAELASGKTEAMKNIASQSFPQFFLQLIPNNIFQVMSTNSSIVSVVIIAALFASALRFLSVKKPEKIKPFKDFLVSSKVAVTSVLTNVIKFMPYGVVALVANTIISNGINSIAGMIGFIAALYTSVIIMLLIYVLILLAVGVNPIQFYKKAFTTLLFAFSSRSSVGTLPYTLSTLENDMGVSNQTSNFIGTLGTTIGMNGCAGVFPAMLGVLVASATGVKIDISFLVLLVIVVTVGSIGIAGVPGTATVAATVTLNGIGLGGVIDSIGAVFGIDPIVDMGRTMLNVCGSMVSAIVVDRWEGNMDMNKFNSKITSKDE